MRPPRTDNRGTRAETPSGPGGGDTSAGVKLACDLVAAVRQSGAFDGVHLIPVRRYRETAMRLEALL